MIILQWTVVAMYSVTAYQALIYRGALTLWVSHFFYSYICSPLMEFANARSKYTI